jgi:hypothetical protein
MLANVNNIYLKCYGNAIIVISVFYSFADPPKIKLKQEFSDFYKYFLRIFQVHGYAIVITRSVIESRMIFKILVIYYCYYVYSFYFP